LSSASADFSVLLAFHTRPLCLLPAVVEGRHLQRTRERIRALRAVRRMYTAVQSKQISAAVAGLASTTAQLLCQTAPLRKRAWLSNKQTRQQGKREREQAAPTLHAQVPASCLRVSKWRRGALNNMPFCCYWRELRVATKDHAKQGGYPRWLFMPQWRTRRGMFSLDATKDNKPALRRNYINIGNKCLDTSPRCGMRQQKHIRLCFLGYAKFTK